MNAMKKEVFTNSLNMKLYIRKKISLFFVCFGIISSSGIAQETPKAKKNQEPIKVAPMLKEEKLIRVNPTEVKQESLPEKTVVSGATTAASPKTHMNNKANMKRLPVKAIRAESIPVKSEK